MASATLGLVTHDGAQPTSAAAHLEGRTTLTCGELAESVGEFERAPRYDGKALYLGQGPRDPVEIWLARQSWSADQR